MCNSTAIKRCLRRGFGIPALCLASTLNSTAIASDNNLAYALFEQEQYAQAAEIFTDPTWKGIALYRSEQWWRAAEAFVRANNAISQYNLGNCYVKLGYYELALDAYLRALSINPEQPAAEHNANLMRELLALKETGKNSQESLQNKQDAIAQIASEETEKGDTEQGNEPEESTINQAPGEVEQGASAAQQSKKSTASQPSAGESAQPDNTPNTPPSDGKVTGKQRSSEQQSQAASGTSEAREHNSISEVSGTRSNVEKEQATEQWLNQIQHNPYQFLKRRIELELQRRQASGQSAPSGGSSW